MTFGAITFLLLAALSEPVTSDESLLAEFAEAHPDADIWPTHVECTTAEVGKDCVLAAGGPFAEGAWRITDHACMEELKSNGATIQGDDCREYLEWYLAGVFHPKYNLAWASGPGRNAQIESPVFAADISVLMKEPSDSRLYLIQRNMFGAEYNLVRAEAARGAIKKLWEYPLSCADAGQGSWKRLGFRHHDRPFREWVGKHCEIRDLHGFRNLARRVLKNKPTRIWEYIGELPESAKDSGCEAACR